MNEKPWLIGRLRARTAWTDRLFSITVEAAYPSFVAGQFARLALPQEDGSMLERPYSLVNAPGAGPLEFYFITLPEGCLSPRLARLNEGCIVYLAPKPSGLFTLASVPAGEALWCLSTGTGLGPFLSILATDEAWQRFGKIVLVHAVREERELAYRDRIATWKTALPSRLIYLPMVSREKVPGTLSGRIPQAIADGLLEAQAGLRLDASSSQVMLCGNPDMLRDTTAALEARGFKKNKRKDPGQITLESYW